MTPINVSAVTVQFADLNGQVYNQTLFGADVTKLVKTIVKYTFILSVEHFQVYGSMVESIDRYWDRTANEGEDETYGYTFH